jgi:hypothetical protein
MAAHLFWGVRVHQRQTANTGAALAELQMRSSVGGANLCTGGTALGTAANSTSVADAFDGSNSTVWYSFTNGGPIPLLGYQFAAPVSVVEMWVRLPGAASSFPGVTYGPAALQPLYSDDGVTWHTGSVTGVAAHLGNDGELAWLVADTPVEYRLAGSTGVLSGRAWTNPLQNMLARNSSVLNDHYYGGPLRIAGAVKIDGSPPVPVRRRVRLYHQLSGRLVRETWSDATTGAYAFEKLAPAEYEVRASDQTLIYDPAAVDRRVPVP